MKLFDLIQMEDSGVIPEKTKLHLATPAGGWDPMEHYLAGSFDKEQYWQRQANFGRAMVVALISMSGPDEWLFAGAYDSKGYETRPTESGDWCVYDLESRPAAENLAGRVVVSFARPGRNSYLNADRWVDRLEVEELRREKVQVPDFPGYSAFILPKARLDLIIRERVESWHVALANVAGVYVITDCSTGAQYVGSATAAEGIWSRWTSYSKTGHGGNQDLRRVLQEHGSDHAKHFQFGVLEIAGSHAGEKDVLQRETHWKNLLQTREHGYNRN